MQIPKNRVRNLLTGILCMAIYLGPIMVAGTAYASDKQPETFKVGQILTLSGPMAAMGLLEKDGLEIAIEDLNKKGGVLVQGKRRLIEPIFYDDEASSRKAIDATHNLINRDKVNIMLAVFREIIRSISVRFIYYPIVRWILKLKPILFASICFPARNINRRCWCIGRGRCVIYFYRW